MNNYIETENVKLAMTHPSYANEQGTKESNQRLEFFGDAILDLIISEYLYINVSKDEGHLTKMRASIVKKESLSRFAKKIKLQDQVKVGRCEDAMKESVLADAFEALLAALYLDHGYAFAKEFILTNFLTDIQELMKRESLDYKSLLQEKVQEKGPCSIQYVLDKQVGKDHDKTFYVSLYVNGKKVASADGKSKKKAEFSCAKKALEDEI